MGAGVPLRHRRARAGTDPVRQRPPMADQPPGHTASQTVGPFLHIALADPAARLAVAEATPARSSCAAGSPTATVTRSPTDSSRRGRSTAASPAAPPMPTAAGTIRTTKPPPAPTRDGTPQAPHLVMSVFARGLLDRVVTRAVLRRRGGRQRHRPDAGGRRRGPTPPARRRRRRRAAATASTSASRATMSPSSSPSEPEPFDFLVSRGPVAEATSATRRGWRR